MPKSLLVIGSGAIGIEFASFIGTLGAQVTVVELLPRILPVEDAEIAALAHKQFESHGMTIITGAKVTGLKKTKTSVTAAIEDADGNKTDIKVERVISADVVVILEVFHHLFISLLAVTRVEASLDLNWVARPVEPRGLSQQGAATAVEKAPDNLVLRVII